MKKTFALLLACLLLSLSACTPGGSSSAPQPDSTPPAGQSAAPSAPEEVVSSLTVTDKTVDLGQFYPTGDETVLHNVYSMREYDNSESKTIPLLYQKSTHIVYGTVERVGFGWESDYPDTDYEFVVWEAYQGDLQPGDKITVQAVGGCLPLTEQIKKKPVLEEKYASLSGDEKENTLYAQLFMGSPIPRPGDVYVLFLSNKNYEPGQPDFPYYVEAGNFSGRFQRGEDAIFSRFVPADAPDFYDVFPEVTPNSYSLKELRQAIEKAKNTAGSSEE